MTKFLTRFFILFTALYFIAVSVTALFGIRFFNDAYIVIAELAICCMCSSQGRYHCKYMKYLAWGIFVGDTVTRTDAAWDYLSPGAAAIIPGSALTASAALMLVSAINHFIKVQKLKNGRKD